MKTEYTMEVGTGKNKEIIVFEAPDGLNDRQLSDLADTALKKAKPGQTFKHPVYDKAEQTHIDTHPKPPATAAAAPGLGANALSGAAGTAKGLASPIDLAAQAMGKVASIPFNALGDVGDIVGNRNAATLGHRVAHDLAFPHTIGEGIDAAVPTPHTPGAHAVRVATELGGGLMVPGGAYKRGAEMLVGRVPAGVNAMSSGQRTVQAARELQTQTGKPVTLMKADVGGSFTRKVTAGLRQSPFGHGPLEATAQKSVASIEANRNAIAGLAGRATDSTGAGGRVKKGLDALVERTKSVGGTLYDKISIPSGKPAVLTNSMDALDHLTSGAFKSNPELAKVLEDPKLVRIRDALKGRREQVDTGILGADGKPIAREVQKGGGLSWEDLKTLRTRVGELGEAARFDASGSKKDYQGLYAALSKDMENTAKAAGPNALKEFQRANTYWRAREARIDGVLVPLLGKDGASDGKPLFEALNRLASERGGDPTMFARAMRSLPKDEADTVRATLISRMGRATAGKQNAQGSAFSVDKFLTDWNNLDPRAKATAFQGPLRTALDNLATVVHGSKQAAAHANTSNTTGAAHVMRMFNTGEVGGVGAALYTGHPMAAILPALGLLGEYSAAKFLAHPVAVETLTRAASARTPQAFKAAVAALGALEGKGVPGARDLARALNDNMPHLGGQAAASPDPGQNPHKNETDEILRSVAEDGRRQQQQWDEEDRQQQQQELPDLQPDAPD